MNRINKYCLTWILYAAIAAVVALPAYAQAQVVDEYDYQPDQVSVCRPGIQLTM